MPIVLSEKTERLIEEMMRRYGYSSPDELIHAALDAFDAYHVAPLDEETLDAIDEAEDQVRRGECHSWDEVEKELRKKYLGG